MICAEVKEIHALETALRIREIRPDVRIVTQMANPSVGRALERVSGRGSVLDVATLAGPSFVEACLRRPAHDIEFAGVHFAVVAGGGDRVRRRSPSDLPRALRQPGPRGHHARRRLATWPNARAGTIGSSPGDRVAVLGTEEELKLGGIDPKRTRRSPLRTHRHLPAAWPAKPPA